ncbi:MAG: carbamoyl-phosphate synthase large subunit [Thermoanaerobaculales bacterium]|jgi:carbamoyl-phosphate synthase large subunit|nr:carbamoyl-phosphate synthase large subunit [Thermoanaerobaculales bacterium]
MSRPPIPESVCVLGAGPIRIGQACEFDYSGVQGVKAMREEGCRVVLVNSNPATVMTDARLAHRSYVEPLTLASVTAVLERERPDALVPTLGGQTALNLAVELEEHGVLERLGVKLLGASVRSIRLAEDREEFRRAMTEAGLPVLPAVTVTSVDQGLAALESIGLPAILRPSFTLGGWGGGAAVDREAFVRLLRHGLEASPAHQVLVETSVLGWKEFELEVMRDSAGAFVVVCSIENLDPMGVHTGDSITVAPAQTLTDREYQVLRDAARGVLDAVGVATGGANVQFAVNPTDGRWAVIEMNPRVSRSSALASKATGFPIARIAAKVALGRRLDEIANDITGSTPASFEPALDYVVVKIPRFAFEKFPGAEPVLGTAMKAVGEVAAMGRSFEEALLKAIRSLEIDRDSLEAPRDLAAADDDGLAGRLAIPSPERLWELAEALRRGWSEQRLAEITAVDPWFVRRIAGLVAAERHLAAHELDPATRTAAKRLGFADSQIARLRGTTADGERRARLELGLRRIRRRVDTCAAEFEARTPYLYGSFGDRDEQPASRRSVVILGGGPVRIGQGIEFDACCVEAVAGVRSEGFEAVMVNCNPETVSTDYDAVDRLHFDPLHIEDVLDICDAERPVGVILQLGGQTPLKLAADLERAAVPIWGTSRDAIDRAEDRGRFSELLSELGLRQPPGRMVTSTAEAEAAGEELGYPLLVRPSYVLGGRAMEIVYGPDELAEYLERAAAVDPDRPVLLDHFLEQASEVDVDAVADGERVVICGIMEHIEEAGVHSGDSGAVTPPVSLPLELQAELRRQVRLLALALGVRGLMNVQFAIQEGHVLLIEVNPRASRTVPFLSRATGMPWAELAARVCAGASLAELGVHDGVPSEVAVKLPVFPFERFPGVDPLPGPEMRSTGEVMGRGRTFGEAFAKAALAAGWRLPEAGGVLLSFTDRDKARLPALAARFSELGFDLLATEGTGRQLREAGFAAVQTVFKVGQGDPDIPRLLAAGDIALVVNTAAGRKAARDAPSIRRAALDANVPYLTTIPGAYAAAEAVAALRRGPLTVRALQDDLGTRPPWAASLS